MIEVGQPIPSFSSTDDAGNTVTSESLKGKKTVLYFYPKDDTPGCTAEACDLRDNYNVLLKAGYNVLGVSPDDQKKHQKFRAKYELPFPLLADTDNSVATAFGVWVEKNMYGKTYMGIKRTTFLIDENGIVAEVIEKVDTKNHTAQILP